MSADALAEPGAMTAEPAVELSLIPAAPVLSGPARVALPTWKRALDLSLGSIALVVTLPLLLVVALAVLLTSRGPVIYRQRRYGQGGRSFTILKFRTMVDGADERIEAVLSCPDQREHFDAHRKLRDDPRITRVGRVLRLFSLDELPQLVNVLRGDMSLVGPRPRWSVSELGAYGHALPTYLSVPPGITGPWQVSGRNDLPDQARVELDLRYAEQLSPRRDLALLLRTVPVLLWPFGRGAY